MTSTAANLLDERYTEQSEAGVSRRTRIAKVLGMHAVTAVWQKASQATRRFLRTNKAPVLTTAGTLVVMAGLAAATAGASQALETTSVNISHSLQAALTDSATSQEARHSWQEGGLGGGGLALVLAGTGTAARGLRTRRQNQPANTFEWSTAQPIVVDNEVVGVDYAANLVTLDVMLDAPYRPTLWERLDAEQAAAAESAAGPAAAEPFRYNGFDTYMVPGAPDINVIAGLTTA